MFEDRGERWREMAEPGFVDPLVRESIPDLDSIPPGPYLAAILASVDRTKLNGYDLVIVLRADDRMASHYQAQRLTDMVELAHCAEGSSDSPATRVQERQDFASDEVRAALSLTRRSAETQLGLAVELAERLPRVLEAFRAGRLSLGKVWVIVRATSHLPDDTAAEVADRVLGEAEAMTTGQLGARLAKLCIEADPESAEKRYEESLAERRVAAEPNVEGTANIYAMELEPHQVTAAMRRINQMAKSLKTAEETRTMDQIRADVFMDLLLGKATTVPGSAQSRGVVDITVDLTTLLELNEKPGEIGGYGPVIADIARQVTEEQRKSEWRWTLTDDEGSRHGQRNHPSQTHCGAAAICGSPESDVCLPGVPYSGESVRDRPQPSLGTGRAHRPRQRRPPLPTRQRGEGAGGNFGSSGPASTAGPARWATPTSPRAGDHRREHALRGKFERVDDPEAPPGPRRSPRRHHLPRHLSRRVPPRRLQMAARGEPGRLDR